MRSERVGMFGLKGKLTDGFDKRREDGFAWFAPYETAFKTAVIEANSKQGRVKHYFLNSNAVAFFMNAYNLSILCLVMVRCACHIQTASLPLVMTRFARKQVDGV